MFCASVVDTFVLFVCCYSFSPLCLYCSDAVEELVQWSNQYVIDANADAIEYDDVIEVSTSPPGRGSSPIRIGGPPSKKRTKHDDEVSPTSTGHISIFASCRRIFEYSTREIPHHVSVFSPNNDGARVGSGMWSMENNMSGNRPHGSFDETNGVPVLPASTHWVKLDGRTHRHRKSLVNKLDDMQDLVTKTNDSIRTSIVPAAAVAAVAPGGVLAGPWGSIGGGMGGGVGGGLRPSIPTHAEMLAGQDRARESASGSGGMGMKSALKFIPNESCGNLADLFSNHLMTQSADSDGKTESTGHGTAAAAGPHNSGIYASANATGDAHANRNVMKLTDLQQHETFYCCVQAAAYISCFHGVYLLHEHMCNESIRRQWECVLTATLNPLKYCLHSVKSEYLRLIELMEFLRPECWAIVQSSRGTVQPSATSTQAVGAGAGAGGLVASSSNTQLAALANNLNKNPNPLGSFFPFDPCLLCKLNTSYVDSKYRSWKGIPGVDFDDDDGRYGSGGADRRNTSGTSITSDVEGVGSDAHRRPDRAGSNTSSMGDIFSDDDDSDRASSFDVSDHDSANYTAFSGTDHDQSDEGYESAVSGVSHAASCESMSVSWLRDSSMPVVNTQNPSTVPKLGSIGSHGPYKNNNYKSGAIPIKRRPRQPSIGSNVSTGSW
jgi:hypothetical protein